MKNIIKIILFYIFLYQIFLYSQTSNWFVLNKFNTGIQPFSYAPSVTTDKIIYFFTGNGQLIKYDGLIKNIKFNIPGIPNNSIRKLIIDRFNNMWFLTYGFGLIKFDGSNFITFNTSNSGLTNNDINDIDFDLQGNLWIATSDGGLFKFDGINWVRYWTGNSNIPDNQLTTVHIDKLNRKWVGTKLPAMVAYFNDTLWVTFNRTNSGINGQIFKIVSDDSNDVWIATGLGISKFDGIRFQHFFYSRGDEYRDIAIDIHKRIWFGGDNVVIYENGNWTNLSDLFPYSLVNKSIINNLIVNGDSVFLVTKNLGLFKVYDSTFVQLSQFNTGIKNNYIKTISIDKNNDYWIGTYGSGLIKLRADKDTLEWDGFLDDGIIYSISFDSSGSIWVGSLFSGLFRYDGNNWIRLTSSNSPLPSNNIVTIKTDPYNVKWIGTSRGLVKVEGDNWTVYTTQNSGLPDNTIGSIVIDNQNNKWLGTNNGLVKFDGLNWVVYNTSNSPLPEDVILSLEIDSLGNLWIGTWNGGLVKFDGINWAIFNKNNSPLPSNRIRALKVDHNGVLWIGTEVNGIVSFDGNNWQIFNRSNSGLPDDFIYDIEVDKFNQKIIATGGGVAFFKEDGIVLENGDEEDTNPDTYVLYQNYPNPFNPITKIRYKIGEDGIVTLKVYNLLGEEVETIVNEFMRAGEYEVEFNASSLPSGVYFYALQAGKFKSIKKMVLLK
ncbi:MAG: T9SS type A sorting domain-containing protein [Ignavibacteria bacterium]|nr:T9SS type A sorting domain-containing protein [Ignavibacteria bacterium]MDH7526797.1 two-component regulator propeller domain-containing protein [Ignavibacteria bacterium]